MENADIGLVEQVQKKLLQYIVEQNIKKGEQFPKESELADKLGVSRVIVREALSSLRTLGFIETRKKRGTTLISPDVFGVLKIIINSGILDVDSLRDLYELRLMLEIGMSDFIFLRKTANDMQLLENIVNQEKEAATTEESIQLDVLFHKTLYKISGNKSLESFQKLLDGLFSIYVPRKKDWQVKQIISHAGLLEVLKSGTPDAFRMAMRLHLNTQFENMEEAMSRIQQKKKANLMN
ncbi:MAG: FCD domain-containing protein [Tannerella sp.]|jgi:DNA-binding FadR family transcriptional regulator|nr:FCD domain-containing protein [Tannerella sp.]